MFKKKIDELFERIQILKKEVQSLEIALERTKSGKSSFSVDPKQFPTYYGIYIPLSIMQIKDLNAFEKTVLSIVYNQERYYGEYKFPDSMLAKMINNTRLNVYRVITKLKEKGYIKKIGSIRGIGNTRILITSEKLKRIL